MPKKITTFLMFEGKAQEAIDFYVSLFPDSKIVAIEKFGPNEVGAEGTIKHATFTLNGQEFMCFDSPPVHNFTFTPAISLFVECTSADEVTTLFKKLSEGGSVLMPLDKYDFATLFAWVSDKYGVTWQLRYTE